MLTRSGGRPGSRRPAGLLAAAALVAVVVAGPIAVPAGAAPSTQPGGTSGVLDSAALHQLQAQAAQAGAGLARRQAEITAARAQLAAAQQQVTAARAELARARTVLEDRQRLVAAYASAVYRDGGQLSPMMLLLSGEDPGEVIAAMGYLDAVDRHTGQVLAAAEQQRRSELAQQTAAQDAADRAQAHAGQLAARVRQLQDAAAEQLDRLTASLGTVDRQLAQLQEQQREVNRRTAANWQAYLGQLAAAGVAPPPAAALRAPTASLPAGLVPVAAHGGGAQAGAAQLPRQPTSLLVLPAETLTAVTTAMKQLGLPYAPGTSGPGSWDCGSLVQAAYGAAGISLPADQAALFAVTTPVDPADVLPGDLVFLGDRQSGLGHVGIALDRQTMLAADGRAGAVVVRKLPADQVLEIGRPSLALRAPVAAPGPVAGALPMRCGDPVIPPSYGGSRAWGGYPDGLIPPSALCPLGVDGQELRCDAAAAYKALSAAYQQAFGTPLCVTDSYRSYQAQVQLYAEKPNLAAVPGTSNHGWGLAVDLCGGIDRFGTAQYDWMLANAGRFGWMHPAWADPGHGREEPWHWEYAGS